MSKAQKGNKEKRKPKADKNQPKTHVSAYKAAQGEGKPSFNRSRERPEARVARVEGGRLLVLLDSSHRPLGAGRRCILPSGHGARHELDRPLLRSSIEQG